MISAFGELFNQTKNLMIKFQLFFLIALVPRLLFSQGSLLLVGGGSEYSTWADAPYGWFVQAADSGKIINIDVDEVSSFYPDYFKSLGAATSAESFRIATRQAANDSNTYKKLISAKGIFIEGGDQGDYIETWKGTRVQDAIHYVFQHGGAIGGTSAGLAVLGEVVYDATGGYLYPDEAAYDPYHPDIHFTNDFLQILPDVLTDSHFHPRGRLARLVPMLARRIVEYGQDSLMGVGVCDNTAIGIDKDGNGTVMGDAVVTIIYKSDDSIIDCQPGKPVTFTNIVYHQLTRGAVFNFNSRKLIETGPYLQAISECQINNEFTAVSLSGIEDNATSLGTLAVSGITSSELAAWKGRLTQNFGQNIIPNAVIINKLMWENSRTETYYYENRWIGGMWAIADKPGFRAIYLNGDRNDAEFNALIDISSTGKLKVNQGVVYILDTHGMSHQCTDYTRAGNRKTNYRGMVNARLHFLKQGDAFDLRVRCVGINRIVQNPDTSEYNLIQNYPNPFNSMTTFQFDLNRDAEVELIIYDIRGRIIKKLARGSYAKGKVTVVWDGMDDRHNPIASGIYLCVCQIGEQVLRRKIVLLK